jgi:hypothetical protein
MCMNLYIQICTYEIVYKLMCMNLYYTILYMQNRIKKQIYMYKLMCMNSFIQILYT